MSEITDEKIALAIQAGDTDKIAVLIERYETKLRRYAKKFLAREEEVDDLVQDVFIKVYENIQSFKPSLRFSPWIYRIAHNVFVNELRRKSRYTSDWFDTDLLFPKLAAKETADAATFEGELSKDMEAAIRELSPKNREVIVLHYYESLSYQEISDVLKIPITTVGARMTRARNVLRSHLPHHE